jgi:hypothetical protein
MVWYCCTIPTSRKRELSKEQTYKAARNASSSSSSMNDKTTKPTEDERQPPPPKKQQQRRGRPPKNTSSSDRDNRNDVLYLKGAAAQQTTHPGNLNYYALCEKRFDEWAALDCDDPERKRICTEIVKIVSQRGGVFRKANGCPMDSKAAVEKTNSRFRQIAKPKLRIHTGMYGEHDVVFAKGARNHMYPGNAKWRSLLDGYAMSYHRDMDKIEEQFKTNFVTQPRPSYQIDIVEETISIVKSRGGNFLDEKLKPISHDVIVDKTHSRFKDMKKEIKAGKLVLSVTKEESKYDTTSGDLEAGANQSAPVIMVNTKSRELATPGFTSVKATISSKKEMQKVTAANKRKRKIFYGNQYKGAEEVRFEDISIPSVPSDEIEVEHDATDNGEEMEEEFKDFQRHERRKRRESGKPAPPTPQQKQLKQKKVTKKRKRTKQIKKERTRSPSPEYTLSEYEQTRLIKMERNHKRLKDLGLS